LTDTVMPKMSGKGLADIVQVSQPDVRVIFMSGYPKEVLYKQGVMDPELHLIQKPFSTDDLLLRIREALNRRLATAERE